tara:strand:- start:180 stop:383 length:204 start_codon:yes stop_codon:yes gene_type:complete
MTYVSAINATTINIKNNLIKSIFSLKTIYMIRLNEINNEKNLLKVMIPSTTFSAYVRESSEHKITSK